MQRGNPNPNPNPETPPSHIKPRLIQHSLEEVSLSLQKERNILLWHDPTISSPHNQKMHTFLSYITEVKGFDDPDKLIQFITDSKPANYTVLTAGTKGEILTKGVSDLLNVSAVYVFCGNVAYHSTWAAQYPKVVHVESDPTRLIMKIFADLRKRVTGHGSLKIDLPVFLEDFGTEGEYKMRNSQLNRITDMEDGNLAQKDLIYLGKHTCGEGEEKEIERFENEYIEYDAAKILKWYSQSEVIARLATNCLKQGTPDALYFGRYLLKDLGKAINESYWKASQEFKGKVYRNIFITDEQWKTLKGNEGKEMVFVDFLRATKVKEEAQKYLKIGIDSNILVTIQVEGHTKEPRKGFAELPDCPQEVLFSAFTRFTIREVSSKDVNGQEEDRELVLGFGFGAEELNPLQEGITFAQCMNCQAVLETGVDEVINLAQHYTCDKCPKEHAVPVVVQKKQEEAIPKLVELKEENEGKVRQRQKVLQGISEPNHSLLSNEINIKNIAAVESVFVPALDKAFPSIHKKEEVVEPAVEKDLQDEKEKAKAKEEEAAKAKEETRRQEEELFEKMNKLKEQQEKEKAKEEVPVVVKKAVVQEDDDEEEEEEEDEEEDEEQARMLELYLKAKEEFENKNYREAIKWYEEILKNPGKFDKVLLGKCTQNLNASHAALGEEVEGLLKILNEKKKTLGKDHAEVKATYKELAQLFAKLAAE